MKLHKQLSSALLISLLGALIGSAAHAQDEQAARMRVALASPERSADNKARDAARKPIEVVQFLGVQSGMTALDVIAAGGWFTEVLSAAVGPTGKVLSQNPQFFLQREGFLQAETERNERLGNVEAVHGDLPGSIGGRADVAVTALNLHDIYNGPNGEAAAVEFLKGIYDALKAGGALGLIDHAGIEGQDNAAFHRMQVQQARDALIKAGFTVEAESNLLANPADDHTKGVRDASLGRQSDQFLIRARKPG